MQAHFRRHLHAYIALKCQTLLFMICTQQANLYTASKSNLDSVLLQS